MSTLYELTGEYQQLLYMLECADDLEERIIKDTLEGIGGELEIKADSYAKIIRELAAEAKKFEEEKKRLNERQASIESGGRILKDHLYHSMKLTGKVKFKTSLFSFGIQKNGGLQTLELVSDVDVPEEFLKKEPDCDKIREVLERGEALPFAVLKERGDHLVIR